MKSTMDVIIYILIGVGCFLLITSLFLPPMGVIDPSVLKAAGILMVAFGCAIAAKHEYSFSLEWKRGLFFKPKDVHIEETKKSLETPENK